MIRYKYIFSLFALMGLLAACNPIQSATSSDSSSGSGTTPATPTQDSSPLYVIVESRYEKNSDNSYIREGSDCYISSTASAPADIYASCTVSIPELRLHYSRLKFTIGTADPDSCSFIEFSPYYFLKSTTSMTLQGNYEAHDCTKYNSDAFCWGGAAQSIMQEAGFSFPGAKGLYFTPSSDGPSSAFTMKSANEYNVDNAAAVTAGSASVDATFASNVFAANNLPSGSRAASMAAHGVDYVGSGQYQDWYVSCRDIYGHRRYSITLTLSDMDTQTAEGVSNDYYDWN